MIWEMRCDILTFPGIKSATTFTVAISHTRHPLSSEVAAKYAESKLCPRFKHNNFQTSPHGPPFSWRHNLRLVNITLKEHKITFLKVEGKPYISLPLLSDFAYSLKLCRMLPNVNSKKGHLMSRSWIDLKAFGSSKMSTKLGHWKTRTCPSYTSTCFLLPSISDDSPICWQNIKKTSSLHSLSKKQETWLLHVGELHKLEQLPQNIWILRMLATMSKHRLISILTLG